MVTKSLVLLCSLVAISLPQTTVGTPTNEPLPKENVSQDGRPDAEGIEKIANELLVWLNLPPTAPAPDNLFFPKTLFLRLKKVPDPAGYLEQLLVEYHHNLSKLTKTLPAERPAKMLRFIPGFCQWKAPGSEYNHIAYWSCYRNKIHMTFGEGEKVKAGILQIRTVINWGADWYITHLGTTFALKK